MTDEEIRASLGGKNPRRVVAQVRRTVRLQRGRVIAHVVVALIMLGLLPNIVRARDWGPLLGCLLFLGLAVLGIVMDYRLLRRARERVRALEEYIERQAP